MTQLLEVKDRYLAHFMRAAAESCGGEPAWLARLREAAINGFHEQGFPTTDQEDWRFTDVSPIAETPFRIAPRAPKAAPLMGITDGPLRSCQLAFVNGRFAPAISSTLGLPDRVQARSLAEVLRSDPGRLEPHVGRHAAIADHPFVALNAAFFEDGAFIHVPKGCVAPEPIHLLFITIGDGDPAIFHPRVLIVLDEGAQATVVESHVSQGQGASFTNAVAEIVLGENAVLDWHKLERESVQAFHVASVAVQQARASTFTSRAIMLGGAIARNDISVVLDGEGAECTLDGLYEATGRQLVDNHTTIDHRKPHGTSRQLYKGILDGHAHGVFNGKVVVRPDAQKTDAVQSNKNLVLSDDATIDTKPELLIFANDVKCKHGATIGQLDADVLFYLRSRGIDAAAAKRLLVHAFSSEILDHVKKDAVRAQLGGCLLTMAPSPGPRSEEPGESHRDRGTGMKA
jgi:Fe-S cluster assembly protein SufD